VNVIFVHDPPAIDAQIFWEILNIVIEEGIHVLDQHLDWGLLDDGLAVTLVDRVLQEQHE